MQINLSDLTDIGNLVAVAVTTLLEGQNKSMAAEAVGVSRQQLYRFEKGEAAPTLLELARLASFAGRQVIVTIQRPGEDEQRLEQLEEAVLLLSAMAQRLHPDDPELMQLVEALRRRIAPDS